MASQMGDYNPYKQSYFARTGEEGRLCSIFCADSMTPKIPQLNCTEFVSHVFTPWKMNGWNLQPSPI